MSTYTRSELENSCQCHQKSIRVLPLSSMLWVARFGARFEFNYRCGFLRIHYSRNPSYDEFAKYTARENFALYGIIPSNGNSIVKDNNDIHERSVIPVLVQ